MWTLTPNHFLSKRENKMLNKMNCQFHCACLQLERLICIFRRNVTCSASELNQFGSTDNWQMSILMAINFLFDIKHGELKSSSKSKGYEEVFLSNFMLIWCTISLCSTRVKILAKVQQFDLMNLTCVKERCELTCR